MSTQNIMWTALPNGLTQDGTSLRLSVLVSPRLTANAATGTLAEFPDFQDWPATVAGLTFSVEFTGGPTVSATPVVEPGNPALDSPAWKALFPATFPVRSYAFDDRSPLAVRSFPTKKVLSFLTNLYQTVAAQWPPQMPTVDQYGFGDDEGGIVPLDEIAIYADEQASLEQQIDGTLDKLRAIPPSFGTPVTDFLQVRLMHQSLLTVPIDANGNRQQITAQTLPDVDFHNAVAGLGSYPMLERALGLVIDLEVPLAGVPASGSVRVQPSLEGPPALTPFTAYSLDTTKGMFLPGAGPGSDVTDGMLLLPSDQYDVVELDVDGGAEKALDFSYNLARLANGDAPTSIDTPDNYGLPSLRSAGFSLARVDRATQLVGTFDTASANNTAITTGSSQVTLHSDDVTRGYRVDVWDSMTRQWHSLFLRDGTYQLLNGPLTRTFSDEGFATVATTQAPDLTSTDLRLPESLFRWAGWSLCAPRPGKTIGPGPTFAPQPLSNSATTAMQLQTSFTVQNGTLPRLRFGAQYQFRVRAVDLAGNSFAPDATLDAAFSLPPQPIQYLRYEPVAAPAVVLRQALSPVATPGESGDRIVIRSNFNTHIEAVSERHIAPPKTSETMAETHGMLDTAAGPPDKTLYTMLVNHDGSFAVDPAHPDQPVPFPGPQLTIPYLPDPSAPGAAFATLPGAPANSVFQVPFTGAWPDTTPFRLVLDEGSGAPEFSENPNERVLRVQLPKAELVTVAMSCFLTDDPTTTPPNMLSTMKIWSLIEAANPAQLADLRTLALNGGHWMLTPPRLLTLVHAVQQPLIEPQFQHLEAAKTIGQTFAVLTDEFPIDGKSTIQVDIQSTWQDPVDDLSTNPQPVILNGAVRAFEVPVEATDTLCVIDDQQQTARHSSNKHEFHDTKHRNVTYTAVATTRFKEYFPDALTANPDNIIRTSQPVTVSVLNSARPAAPKPLYVVPAFGWETDTEGAWQISKRRGGALRVYLDRPWFSSGEGELLAAVLLGTAPAPGTVPGYQIPDSFKGYVTQWGQDPIWSAAAPPTVTMPLPQHFLNAVAIGTELTLDELQNVSNEQSIPFTAVGHQVSYDDAHGRRLWYCDIQMDMGEAYFPFVRLALARYQPQSLPNVHLSRLVLADFMQLAPDRAASITFDPIDPTSVELAVNGLTYTGPGTAAMTATLEMQVPGSANSAWLPVADIPLLAHTFGGPDTLWTGPVVLPAPRGSRPFRLVIREFETYTTDSSGSEQQRLVYADILNLQGTVITATPPASGSPLDGFWGSDDSVHVNFLGTDNHVHELYIAPGNNWVDNDLTALAGAVAPTANTALDGYWGTDDSVHVNFLGTDNHIHELYIAPGNNWVDNDLTALAGAVAPTANTALDGYWGTDSSVHVNFLGTDNHIHELYIAPGNNWVDNDLTALAGAVAPTANTALDGYWGTDSSVHVNFLGTDNHIHELYIAPGNNWVDNDLTALAGAVAPTANTALDGYWGTDSSVHVNFLGTDNHIHELYIAPGNNWVDNDLTALAGAVAPTANTALDGYWGTDNSQHVNYLGTDNHIHELYIAPGNNWVDNDLTALAGAVAPTANTALDGYWGTDNSQHVNYLGTDNHIHELYIAPNTNWVDNDLTALA